MTTCTRTATAWHWTHCMTGSWIGPPCGRTPEAMATRELGLAKPFLDRVESRPLTEEQARAVICFDNRVQVVAAAGSGKTSTMVARPPMPSIAASWSPNGS